MAIRILGAEDHLRLLCLHLIRHSGLRGVQVRWLCDVAAALEAVPADFDWGYFRSGKRLLSQWAVAILGLAHHVLQARLPGAIAEEAAQVPHWLVKAQLSYWEREARTSLLPVQPGFMEELRRRTREDLDPIKACFRRGLAPDTRVPLLVPQFVGMAHTFHWLLRRSLLAFRTPKVRPFEIHRAHYFLGIRWTLFSKRRPDTQ
jgi:hypothetical protein